MKVLFRLLVIFASTCCAFGRLGETEAQIIARYGQSTGVKQPQTNREYLLFFKFKGYQITVGFLDGKSQWESYDKLDHSQQSDDELKILLDKNSLGSTWIKGDTGNNNTIWHLQSGKAVAVYTTGVLNSLSIKTSEWEAYQKQRSDDIAKKRIEDLQHF